MGIKEREMQFRIHGENESGQEDSVVVTGDTLDECITKALHEEAKRNWVNCWSEELPRSRRFS